MKPCIKRRIREILHICTKLLCEIGHIRKQDHVQLFIRRILHLLLQVIQQVLKGVL